MSHAAFQLQPMFMMIFSICCHLSFASRRTQRSNMIISKVLSVVIWAYLGLVLKVDFRALLDRLFEVSHHCHLKVPVGLWCQQTIIFRHDHFAIARFLKRASRSIWVSKFGRVETLAPSDLEHAWLLRFITSCVGQCAHHITKFL